MVHKITILHTPDCPNADLIRRRLADALGRLDGPPPEVTAEEIGDPDEATRRGFLGSPSLLVDDVDVFAGPGDSAEFACRTYRTEAGTEGAPSVDQLVAALTTG